MTQKEIEVMDDFVFKVRKKAEDSRFLNEHGIDYKLSWFFWDLTYEMSLLRGKIEEVTGEKLFGGHNEKRDDD